MFKAVRVQVVRNVADWLAENAAGDMWDRVSPPTPELQSLHLNFNTYA
jgi:hypothetical protein